MWAAGPTPRLRRLGPCGKRHRARLATTVDGTLPAERRALRRGPGPLNQRPADVESKFVITLEAVTKTYAGHGRPAVAGVDLHVDRDSLLVILGESGSGKTTTLKMINRLVEPTSGRVLIDGQDARAHRPEELRRRIGYAFQGIGLFPHMSVAENIAVVPRLLGWPRPEIERRIDELLESVALPAASYRERYPSELSGGQQQRVGLARALAGRASILLMDEPFGALDPITRDQLQRELKALQKSLALTAVLVTHDVTEALLLADRIAVMKDGRILGHGTPRELLANPEHAYIASLMEMPKRQAQQLASMERGAP